MEDTWRHAQLGYLLLSCFRTAGVASLPGLASRERPSPATISMARHQNADMDLAAASELWKISVQIVTRVLSLLPLGSKESI